MSDDENDLFLSKFPDRESKTARKVYFDELGDTMRGFLAARNYTIVMLMDLPRETVADHQNYLFALLQGMAEGTIAADKQRVEAVQLEMRARHMLERDSVLPSSSTATVEGGLDAVWDWAPSRNTLQGNSTMVDPRRVDAVASMVQDAMETATLPKKRGRPRVVRK